MAKATGWDKISETRWDNEFTDTYIEVRDVGSKMDRDVDEPWEVLKFSEKRGMDMGDTLNKAETKSEAIEKARDYIDNFPFNGEKQHLMDEAHDMGFEDAEGVAEESPENDVSKIVSMAEDSITQSASWSNHTLPELRKMAGFRDSGAGTYQIGGEENQRMLDALIDSYWEGFRNKVKREV